MRTIAINRTLPVIAACILFSQGCEKNPDADFNIVAVNNEVNIYNPVIFQNTSVNGNTYEWSFGDGNTSTDSDPNYQYTTAGTYTVTLKAFSESERKVSEISKVVDVNKWYLTGLDYSFGSGPVFWGDEDGCFEPSCDMLNARIYFYAGASTTPVYASPVMPMSASTTNSAEVTLESDVIFTDETWKLSFIHEYENGSGKKFAEYTFNPVTTPDNGISDGKWTHYIGFSSGNVGIGLTLYFIKKPE